MNHSLAFFNLCTCEKYGSEGGPVLRARARPIEANLVRLFDFARGRDIVVVSTRCLQGGKAPPLGPTIPRELAVIPPVSSEEDMSECLSSCNEVLIERQSYPTVEEIRRTRANDVFRGNASTDDVVRTIAVDHWVVFGVGCIPSAASGLLKRGKQVTILADATLPGAAGGETREEMLDELRRQGARIETTDRFLGKLTAAGTV